MSNITQIQVGNNTYDIYDAGARTLINQKADSSALADYLPLSGGTVDGNTYFGSMVSNTTLKKLGGNIASLSFLTESSEMNLNSSTAWIQLVSELENEGVMYDTNTFKFAVTAKNCTPNYLSLSMNKNNVGAVEVSHPAAWRTALELDNEPTITTVNYNSTLVKSADIRFFKFNRWCLFIVNDMTFQDSAIDNWNSYSNQGILTNTSISSPSSSISPNLYLQSVYQDKDCLRTRIFSGILKTHYAAKPVKNIQYSGFIVYMV